MRPGSIRRPAQGGDTRHRLFDLIDLRLFLGAGGAVRLGEISRLLDHRLREGSRRASHHDETGNGGPAAAIRGTSTPPRPCPSTTIRFGSTPDVHLSTCTAAIASSTVSSLTVRPGSSASGSLPPAAGAALHTIPWHRGAGHAEAGHRSADRCAQWPGRAARSIRAASASLAPMFRRTTQMNSQTYG